MLSNSDWRRSANLRLNPWRTAQPAAPFTATYEAVGRSQRNRRDADVGEVGTVLSPRASYENVDHSKLACSTALRTA
jgi:hypothetical protein